MASRRRAAKYTIVAVILVLVVWVAVNGALLVASLTGITIPPSQAQGNALSLVLEVPNHSYVPIQGRVVTNVYDSGTGSLIGSGNNSFALQPGTVNPVTISVQITQKTSNPIRITMDYYIGAYGVNLPFSIRGADVTIAPPTG